MAEPGIVIVTRGIYILANNRMLDHAVALVASIRARDAETPICLIPYDDQYREVASVLGSLFRVELYEDLALIERVAAAARYHIGESGLLAPNNFRKQACWFGPFDEFLYVDADIVVFERISNLLDHLADYDFVCCDDQHENGLTHVFTDKILEEGIFTVQELSEVFNAGFWAARRGLFTEDDLFETFAQCGQRRACFPFDLGVTDQPIMNYLVLTRLRRRLNLYRRPSREPRVWAGAPGFRQQGDRLVDPLVGRPLRYIHWAGMQISPEAPYWPIWRHYRFLDRRAPRNLSPAVRGAPTWWRALRRFVPVACLPAS